MTTAHAIRIALIAIGGFLLMAMPLFARRAKSMKTYPSWALVAWFVAGATAVAYLGVGYFVHSLGIRDRWLPLLSHLRSLIGGIAIGIILTLVLWYFLGYLRTPTRALDSTSR
jgi:hypothetical protein